MKQLRRFICFFSFLLTTTAFASGYQDFKSIHKDDNNHIFINKAVNHLGNEPSDLRFLVLDGPRLGTTQKIHAFFQNSGQTPEIIVPQINPSDFKSIILSKEYYKYKPTVKHDSINGFLKKIEKSEDYNHLPNAVYFDYMGSAGGNQDTQHFPFEDLMLYLSLAASGTEKVTIGMTFCLRTADIPLLSFYDSDLIENKQIKTAIRQQLRRIVESQGFQFKEPKEDNLIDVTYQRTKEGGDLGTSMHSVFMNLERNPSLEDGEVLEEQPSFIKSSRAMLDLQIGKVLFRDWGFSGQESRSWHTSSNRSQLVRDSVARGERLSFDLISFSNTTPYSRQLSILERKINSYISSTDDRAENYLLTRAVNPQLHTFGNAIKRTYLEYIIFKDSYTISDYNVLKHIDKFVSGERVTPLDLEEKIFDAMAAYDFYSYLHQVFFKKPTQARLEFRPELKQAPSYDSDKPLKAEKRDHNFAKDIRIQNKEAKRSQLGSFAFFQRKSKQTVSKPISKRPRPLQASSGQNTVAKRAKKPENSNNQVLAVPSVTSSLEPKRPEVRPQLPKRRIRIKVPSHLIPNGRRF